MPGFFRRLFGRFSRSTGPGIGHRGLATGLGSRGMVPGSGDTWPKILAKDFLPEDEVSAFLRGGHLLVVNSSWIAAAQYYPGSNKMMMVFLDRFGTPKSASMYGNISPREALSFAQAGSKGIWWWDHIGVRGSRTARQKPGVQIRGSDAPIF